MEMTWPFVLICLGVVWAGYRWHRENIMVMNSLESCEPSEKQDNKPQTQVTVDQSIMKKTKQRNRMLRRRMDWARRRLVVYPELCKYKTKLKALHFVKRMIESGPMILKRQGIAVLKEVSEVAHEKNSVHIVTATLEVLKKHDSRWYKKHHVPKTVYKNKQENDEIIPEVLLEAA